ncbi:MAG: hypothetical protein U0X74_08495 [Anaerolineales bacterium]
MRTGGRVGGDVLSPSYRDYQLQPKLKFIVNLELVVSIRGATITRHYSTTGV